MRFCDSRNGVVTNGRRRCEHKDISGAVHRPPRMLELPAATFRSMQPPTAAAAAAAAAAARFKTRSCKALRAHLGRSATQQRCINLLYNGPTGRPSVQRVHNTSHEIWFSRRLRRRGGVAVRTLRSFSWRMSKKRTRTTTGDPESCGDRCIRS